MSKKKARQDGSPNRAKKNYNSRLLYSHWRLESMKSTGIVRKLDELGRITLPIELRKSMNIGPKEPMEMFVDGESIVIRKYNNDVCRCCGEVENLITVDIAGEKSSICRDCYTLFGQAVNGMAKAGVISGR